MDFPSGSVVNSRPAKGVYWVSQVQFLGREDAQDKGMKPTPVFLPGKSHGQRNLAGYSPWGPKESDKIYQQNSSSSNNLVRVQYYARPGTITANKIGAIPVLMGLMI